MISVKVVGAGDASRKLFAVGRAALNLSPAFDDIGEYYRGQLHRQFLRAGVGMGGAWRPLSPRTVKRKGHNTILFDTNGLYKSYTRTSSPFNISQVSRNSGKFGSWYMAVSDSGKIIPAAVFHQMGTRRGGRSYMPARPVIQINRQLTDKIGDEIIDHLFKGWNLR